MGVEYERYLIPRPNGFFPEPKKIVSLIEAMAKGNWIVTPNSSSFRQMEFSRHAKVSGAYARTCEGYLNTPFPIPIDWIAEFCKADWILCWPVENLAQAGLTYPLNPRNARPDLTYYKLQLHFCRDYVYHTSELIDPFDSAIACESCGAELEFWKEDKFPYSFASGATADIFNQGRIRSVCPQCEKLVDISKQWTQRRDGWSNKEVRIQGGACYRFAIVMDCGNCMPDTHEVQFDQTFVQLCRKQLGCDFTEIGDMH